MDGSGRGDVGERLPVYVHENEMFLQIKNNIMICMLLSEKKEQSGKQSHSEYIHGEISRN